MVSERDLGLLGEDRELRVDHYSNPRWGSGFHVAATWAGGASLC